MAAAVGDEGFSTTDLELPLPLLTTLSGTLGSCTAPSSTLLLLGLLFGTGAGGVGGNDRVTESGGNDGVTETPLYVDPGVVSGAVGVNLGLANGSSDGLGVGSRDGMGLVEGNTIVSLSSSSSRPLPLASELLAGDTIECVSHVNVSV